MESLDIALKRIKAVFIYNMLREGVPEMCTARKSNKIMFTM